MEYRVENKKLYIAKKLLDLLDNRPNSILFIDQTDSSRSKDLAVINVKEELDFTPEITEQKDKKDQLAKPYELMSIKTELLPQLFPGLTKKEVHEGFLSLEKQGVIEYRVLEETHFENYEKIKFFNVRIDKQKLDRFITIANSGLFGFNLSDKDFYNEVVTVIETLQNSNELKIAFSDFHSENAFDILRRIESFSDAIYIVMKENGDYDVDINEGGQAITNEPEYLPESIIINDKTKVADILAYIEKHVEAIYIQGVDLFLEKYKILNIGCSKCGHISGKCQTTGDILQYLDLFSRGGFIRCQKCRAKNVFSINSEGELTYSLLKT